MDWKKLTSKEIVESTIKELEKREITAFYVQNRPEAKEKALSLISKGSRVLVSTSVTAEQIGLKEEIDNGEDYKSVRSEYMALDKNTQADRIRELRSAPEVIVGSVHAVTERGEVLVASNTGSQIPGYSYAAGKVIWLVGTQKIVKNMDEAFKRLTEYVVPLEEQHMQEQYGVGTNLSKILIINKEKVKNRIFLIFINEVLGF